MQHDSPPTHPRDHNQGPDLAHLHSHPHGLHEDDAVLDTFISGFVAANDKTSFLRLARVPFEMPSRFGDRRPSLKLVDVEVRNGFQVGTASPAFGSRELVYHPYPGSMVRARTRMTFVYVSLDERREVDLAEVIAPV